MDGDRRTLINSERISEFLNTCNQKSGIPTTLSRRERIDARQTKGPSPTLFFLLFSAFLRCFGGLLRLLVGLKGKKFDFTRPENSPYFVFVERTLRFGVRGLVDAFDDVQSLNEQQRWRRKSADGNAHFFVERLIFAGIATLQGVNLIEEARFDLVMFHLKVAKSVDTTLNLYW